MKECVKCHRVGTKCGLGCCVIHVGGGFLSMRLDHRLDDRDNTRGWLMLGVVGGVGLDLRVQVLMRSDNIPRRNLKLIQRSQVLYLFFFCSRRLPRRHVVLTFRGDLLEEYVLAGILRMQPGEKVWLRVMPEVCRLARDENYNLVVHLEAWLLGGGLELWGDCDVELELGVDGLSGVDFEAVGAFVREDLCYAVGWIKVEDGNELGEGFLFLV